MYTYDYKYQKYMSYASKYNKHVPNTMYLIFQSWLWSTEVILNVAMSCCLDKIWWCSDDLMGWSGYIAVH